jgi:hypothetical protein
LLLDSFSRSLSLSLSLCHLSTLKAISLSLNSSSLFFVYRSHTIAYKSKSLLTYLLSLPFSFFYFLSLFHSSLVGWKKFVHHHRIIIKCVSVLCNNKKSLHIFLTLHKQFKYTPIRFVFESNVCIVDMYLVIQCFDTFPIFIFHLLLQINTGSEYI